MRTPTTVMSIYINFAMLVFLSCSTTFALEPGIHESAERVASLVLPGDYDSSGSVDLADAVIGLQLLAGQPISQSLDIGADINADQKIGLAEVIYCLEALSDSSSHTAIRHANWPLEVLSWNLDKAYPGLEYNYRLGVRGGQYPYTFHLNSSPDDMEIDRNTGTITWTPSGESSGNIVEVDIIDSKGSVLRHTFTIDVDKASFYFLSPSGSNSNDGSETSPWTSLAHASQYAGNTGYVYVRGGTYREAFTINNESCGRFLVYPGEDVTIVGIGNGNSSISIRGGSNMIFQGFTFDANNHRWLFSLDAPLIENVIWRKNVMHNAASNDTENPAFIFFWDGSQKPIEGEIHYRNMVIQDNIFHDLDNPNDHGASTTLYDVQDLLYEDNEAYDIDGRGVSDKDDGFMNTFRNNAFYNCKIGIGLWNQNNQGKIEISHNLVHDCDNGVVLGGQPGYLRDVFVHHNTILGDITFSLILNRTESVNFNIHHNIIGDGLVRPYNFIPIKILDDDTQYHYEYPIWFQDIDNTKVRINNNFLWGPGENNIAGHSWGIPQKSLAEWQAAGFDIDSISANPELDLNFSLAPDSQYWGIYGRDK